MKKKNIILFLSIIVTYNAFAATPRKPAAGMLFFAHYTYEDNDEVINNPYIIGALYTFHWDAVEHEQGKFDWSAADKFIEKWTKAGKKVALRIMWSTNGYWLNPIAKHPTPAWVWKDGAKHCYHPDSETEIPLLWDPIFRKHAMNFQKAINQRYGNNPNILFIDVTPGAETNPYRGSLNRRSEKSFDSEFCNTATSDGRKYSNELWIETVCSWIEETSKIFTDLPCLVTLNQGGIGKSNNFEVFGQCAVDNGMYVGQNGLHSQSFISNNKNLRIELFNKWHENTLLFFEMVHPADVKNTGSLQGVMEAAQRINCDYLNVYAVDVLKSGKKNIHYSPEWESAMKYGATWFKSKTIESRK